MVQRMVRQSNLSQELSDLVVYCQPVPFDIESRLLYWHDKLPKAKQKLDSACSNYNCRLSLCGSFT